MDSFSSWCTIHLQFCRKIGPWEGCFAQASVPFLLSSPEHSGDNATEHESWGSRGSVQIRFVCVQGTRCFNSLVIWRSSSIQMSRRHAVVTSLADVRVWPWKRRLLFLHLVREKHPLQMTLNSPLTLQHHTIIRRSHSTCCVSSWGDLKIDFSSAKELPFLLLPHHFVPLHAEPTSALLFSGVCQKAFGEMLENHYEKQNSAAERKWNLQKSWFQHQIIHDLHRIDFRI